MQSQLETVQFDESKTSFHYFRVQPLYFEPFWHYHPEIELTYVARGEGLRYVGNHITPFQEGDLVLIGENLPHQWVSSPHPRYASYDAHVFQFPLQMFEHHPEFDALRDLFSAARKGLHYPHPDPALLHMIVECGSMEGLEKLIRFFEILQMILADRDFRMLSTVAYRDPRESYTTWRVSHVTSFILGHLDQPLSVDEVAGMCGLSSPAFCRWFKQSMGMTFVTYLNIARIELACHHLMRSDWQISEIAFRVGFENISHFNRTFKKIKNTSPGKWRRGRQ